MIANSRVWRRKLVIGTLIGRKPFNRKIFLYPEVV